MTISDTDGALSLSDDGTLLAEGTIGGSIALAIASDKITSNAILGGKIEPTRGTRIWWAMLAERRRAEAKHGVQNLHPIGSGAEFKPMADLARHACDVAFAAGEGTWRHIVTEEHYEAFAEDDPQAFVTEAIQAMGTWFAAIDAVLEQNPDLTLPDPF